MTEPADRRAAAMLHSALRSAALVGVMLVASAQATAQPLQDAVHQILATGDLAEKLPIAATVVDATTGELLADVNGSEQLIPASNMKLFTSAAAIDVFSDAFAFETTLAVEATDAGPRVVVRGSGDPAFADPYLLERMGLSVEDFIDVWAAHLVRAQAASPVEIVVDDRVFDDAFVHPTWPEGQLNRWYCAEVAGLNFHVNIIEIFTDPGEPGRPPTIVLEPEAPWLRIANKAKSVGANRKHTAWAARAHAGNTITLLGDVRHASTPVRVALHDPPIFFGRVLADRLRGLGGEPGDVRRAREDESFPAANTVHVVRTPLRTVLERCNKRSWNLYAEALLKRLGHEVTGARGSWENGAAVVRMTLADRLGPAGAADLVIADGSGMSRDNRVSTSLIAAWLASFVDDEDAWPELWLSLPAPGEQETTLRRRFTVQHPANAVRAKTGYLLGVSALSGYLRHEGTGHTAVFSVVSNEKPSGVPLSTVRRVEEQIVLLLDRYITEQANPARLDEPAPINDSSRLADAPAGG